MKATVSAAKCSRSEIQVPRWPSMTLRLEVAPGAHLRASRTPLTGTDDPRPSVPGKIPLMAKTPYPLACGFAPRLASVRQEFRQRSHCDSFNVQRPAALPRRAFTVG